VCLFLLRAPPFPTTTQDREPTRGPPRPGAHLAAPAQRLMLLPPQLQPPQPPALRPSRRPLLLGPLLNRGASPPRTPVACPTPLRRLGGPTPGGSVCLLLLRAPRLPTTQQAMRQAAAHRATTRSREPCASTSATWGTAAR